ALDRGRILVGPAQQELRREPRPSPRVLQQRTPSRFVVPAPGLEAEVPAERSRRDVRRLERRLDEDRPRSAERIEERRAPIPARVEDDRRRERLRERSPSLVPPPAALVERVARC